MKGKLIKIEDKGYYNFEDPKGNLIATSYKFKNPDSTYLKKLSLKNCESIENGYDLDELAYGYDLYEKGNFVGQMRTYKEGFNKALSILGDKKFNQNDVLDVVNHVLHEMVLVEGFDKQYLFPESVYHEVTTKCKSIQQKEWDVEIEMYIVPEGWENKPKLDEDGCLILKKI